MRKILTNFVRRKEKPKDEQQKICQGLGIAFEHDSGLVGLFSMPEPKVLGIS